MSAIRFEIVKKSGASQARAGVIHTAHGAFSTPAFSTVGTKGTVKGILPDDLRELGVEVALSNTYHLFLQPGEDVIKTMGGLHEYMRWQGPLITDSGGFQVFSLGVAYNQDMSKFVARGEAAGAAPAVYDEDVAGVHGKLAIVDDEGVTFTSHIDGSLHRFTPERSIEIQHKLGADIFFAFDDFVSPVAPEEEQIKSMKRTHAWARRSLDAHSRNLQAMKQQAIFGIIQGGRYPHLRRESAAEIGAMPFDGFGIGGSFSKEDLGEALQAAIEPLPADKPRHLLGIGEPEDLFEGVANGIDMFDCVLPTRLGRTGTIYTLAGKIDLRKDIYKTDTRETLGYSYAYLHHLFRAHEMLGPIIASMHNVRFIVGLVADIRQSILDDRFDDFRADFLSTYKT